MSATDKPIRILTNDDGWILSTYGPPIRIDELRDKMIGPHAHTPIRLSTPFCGASAGARSSRTRRRSASAGVGRSART